VKPDQTVAIQAVSPGTSEGNVTAVDGLNVGDTIAIDGFDKLQGGVKVVARGEPDSSSGRVTQ